MTRRHPSTRSRRGSLYVAVLISSSIVTAIGLSAMLLVRVNQQTTQDVVNDEAARIHARAALELGLQRFRDEPEWFLDPTTRWYDGFTIGDGTLTLDVTPNKTGDATQGFVLRGEGRQGDARHMTEIEIELSESDDRALADVMLDDGPIFYWRLEETSGTDADDEMDDENGLYKGPPSLGEQGCTLSTHCTGFDGVAAHVAIDHDSDMLIDDGTVELWVQPSTTAGRQGIFSKDATDRGRGGHFTIAIVAGRIEAQLSSTTTDYLLQSGVISSGDWYHVAVTFGSGGYALWVNGTKQDSLPYTGGWGLTSGDNGNEEPIALGADTSETDVKSLNGIANYFAGRIDEVAIYPVALDSTRIDAHYDVGTAYPSWRVVPGSWAQVVD